MSRTTQFDAADYARFKTLAAATLAAGAPPELLPSAEKLDPTRPTLRNHKAFQFLERAALALAAASTDPQDKAGWTRCADLAFFASRGGGKKQKVVVLGGDIGGTK